MTDEGETMFWLAVRVAFGLYVLTRNRRGSQLIGGAILPPGWRYLAVAASPLATAAGELRSRFLARRR